jgi:recombination protein RecA
MDQFDRKEVFATGSIRLDLALGTGGIQPGQIVEIAGAEGAGKTTLCLSVISEAQKMGRACAFVDVDHSLDPAFAARCGVAVNDLLFCEPMSEEHALDATVTLACSGSIDVLVLDSITALAPGVEIESALGDQSLHESFIHVQHQQLSRALNKVFNLIQHSEMVLLLTDRVTRGMAAVYHDLADDLDRLAIKQYSTLRMRLRNLQPILKTGQIVGQKVEVRIIKSKLAPNIPTLTLDILYNGGISKTGEILALGSALMLINRHGSAYYFQKLKLGVGRDRAIDRLQDDPDLCAEIEKIIRQRLLSPD